MVNSSGFTGIAQGSTLNLGTGGLAGAINTPAIANEGQWPAPGSEDTELGVILEPEVVYGTQTLWTRVQA